LAQVSGRNDLSWDARIAADVDYVTRCSLGLDLMILAQTIARVLRRSGVAVDPGAVMDDLDVERARQPAGRQPLS
jgi:hypothetical protein